MCILSRTKKTEEVKEELKEVITYFLEIEKLVIKHNKHIQDALEKKLE